MKALESQEFAGNIPRSRIGVIMGRRIILVFNTANNWRWFAIETTPYSRIH